MAVCFEEQRESELSLPEIETKPLTSTKADEKAKPKKRPTSGSKNVFPRARKFSLEDPERIKQLEKGFVLDGVVLSRMTNEEIKRTNPSINIGIPQYKALEDRHCSSYFRMKTVPQKMPKDSMIGGIEDKFFKSTEAVKYIEDRNEKGTSYTRRLYGGHTTVPTEPSKDGYNGPEGYRRNTFDLRRQRSVFDYEDPFENPKPLNHRVRTQSAPATIQLMRQKSASAYRSYPGGRRYMSAVVSSRRTQLAMPMPLEPVKELATVPN